MKKHVLALALLQALSGFAASGAVLAGGSAEAQPDAAPVTDRYAASHK